MPFFSWVHLPFPSRQGKKLGELDATTARYRSLGLLYFEVVDEEGEKLILCGASRDESRQWLETLRGARRQAPPVIAVVSPRGPGAGMSASGVVQRAQPQTPVKQPRLSSPAAPMPSAASPGPGTGGSLTPTVMPKSPRPANATPVPPANSGSRSPRESTSNLAPAAAGRSPRESTTSSPRESTVGTPKSPRFSIFGMSPLGQPRSPRVKSGNYRALDGVHGGGGGESDSGVAGAASSDNTDHFGWMSKKGKERWFLLRDHALFWFTKEQPLDTDIRKEVRGSLALENCTVSTAGSDGVTVTAPGGVAYTMTCQAERERDEWVKALEASIRDVERQLQTDTKKSGWLEKKKQRRWFVLQDMTLAWYVKEGDVRERGQLNLADCNCIEDNATTFTLVNVNDDQIRYQMVAKTAEECREWMTSLRRACARAQAKEAEILRARATARQNAEMRKGGQVTLEKKGWFTKKRKKRYYVLRNTVLMWFVNETDVNNNATMKGSLEMTDCSVTARGFDLQIRTKEGVVYVLTAQRKQEVDDWVTAIKDACAAVGGGGSASGNGGGASSVMSRKSGVVPAAGRAGSGGMASLETKRGWAVKKGKRRFLVLRAGELLYFDKEHLGTGEITDKPKGSIRLATASANEVTVNTFLVRSEGSTEGWVFETPEAGAWVKALNVFIAAASTDGGLSHSGWMVKKGKRRWFALRKGLLMWFSEVQAQVDPEQANGSLLLKRCRVVEDSKTKTIVITPHADMNEKPLELVCYTPGEMSEWLSALKGGQADASQTTMVDPFASTGTGLVFGRPIAEVLEREQTQVPNIVTTCCNYLRDTAIEHSGLFRLSGSAASINKLRDAFDAGEDVDFAKEEVDLDSVAGLLKLYIRQLPEPPLTFELYKEFLAAHDNPTNLAALVLRLPQHQRDFTIYLLDFLCEIAALSDRNQMTPSNIAIVMGPNLLRPRDGEGDLVTNLKETPIMLSCCKTLVASWEQIRPSE